MTTGLSASVVLSFGGKSASPDFSEVDLAIDLGGDLLQINPAGDVLIVSPAVTWTGQSASFGGSFIGQTAALVVGGSTGGNVLGDESGGIIGLEGGGELGLG